MMMFILIKTGSNYYLPLFGRGMDDHAERERTENGRNFNVKIFYGLKFGKINIQKIFQNFFFKSRTKN